MEGLINNAALCTSTTTLYLQYPNLAVTVHKKMVLKEHKSSSTFLKNVQLPVYLLPVYLILFIFCFLSILQRYLSMLPYQSHNFGIVLNY